jgi:hypothetical protein
MKYSNNTYQPIYQIGLEHHIKRRKNFFDRIFDSSIARFRKTEPLQIDKPRDDKAVNNVSTNNDNNTDNWEYFNTGMKEINNEFYDFPDDKDRCNLFTHKTTVTKIVPSFSCMEVVQRILNNIRNYHCPIEDKNVSLFNGSNIT